MQGYAHVIVIIPYTTAGGGSARPVRGSVHGGRRVTGAGGGSRGPKHKGSGGGVRVEGTGRGAKERGGPVNQLASLLLCKC